MLIRSHTSLDEIVAGDGSRLSEIFHPDREYQFSGRYSLAQATVEPGAATSKHRLTSDEVYIIISGRGEIQVDSETATIGPGDAVDIPPGSVQSIRNIGDTDLKFLCIVDPAWRADDEEILD